MPLKNSSRSARGFTLRMVVPGSGSSDYVTIPNVGDIEVASPASPTESFKYLDGTADQYSGTADPETLTINTSFQPNSDEYEALAAAKLSGAEIEFQLMSGPETVLYAADASKTATGAALAAITASNDASNPGQVTFSNAAGATKRRLPSFGRAGMPGKFGKGDCIKLDGKYYRLVSTSGTGAAEKANVKLFPVPPATDTSFSVVAADVFSIVKPQIVNEFVATITNAGQFSASPSSPVPTDQLGLALVSGLAGNWVLVPTS